MFYSFLNMQKAKLHYLLIINSQPGFNARFMLPLSFRLKKLLRIIRSPGNSHVSAYELPSKQLTGYVHGLCAPPRSLQSLLTLA